MRTTGESESPAPAEVARVRRQWDRLGHGDPYWAVLTRPDCRGNKWDHEAFFATGEVEIARVFQRFSRLGIAPGQQRALDYGCGVGRLSRSLALRFDVVIGVDISASMLAEAQRANADFGNLSFVPGSGHCLSAIHDDSVNLVYCSIVLQHSPRAVQLRLLSEFGRVLAPGGIAVIQVPSAPNPRTVRGLAHIVLGNRLMNLLRAVRFGKRSVMEMHPIKPEEIRRAFDRRGLIELDAVGSGASGRAFLAHSYIVRKPAAA